MCSFVGCLVINININGCLVELVVSVGSLVGLVLLVRVDVLLACWLAQMRSTINQCGSQGAE